MPCRPYRTSGRLSRVLRLVSRLAVVTTALASTVLVGTAHADSTHRYRLVELGTLGGEFSAARSVNDADEVVGYSQVAGSGESHAFLWCAGTMTDLGTLPGGASSVALDINNRGQIVGQATTATGAVHAVMWQRGVVSDLGTFGGAD